MSDQTRIDWCDASINPFGWGCWGPGGTEEHPRRCSYCFAARIAARKLRDCPDCQAFRPHWHPEELNKPLHWKRPRRIFVQSMGDPFGDWVTDDQLDQVLDVMADCPQHMFYLLTKQPQNIMAKIYNSTCRPPFIFRRALPRNVWLGASVDTQARAQATEKYMGRLSEIGWHTFVSVEPLLEDIGGARWLLPYQWVIVGSQTGPGAEKHRPQREWIESIMAGVDMWGAPVFLKSSITALWPDLDRREWPNA